MIFDTKSHDCWQRVAGRASIVVVVVVVVVVTSDNEERRQDAGDLRAWVVT